MFGESKNYHEMLLQIRIGEYNIILISRVTLNYIVSYLYSSYLTKSVHYS